LYRLQYFLLLLTIGCSGQGATASRTRKRRYPEAEHRTRKPQDTAYMRSSLVNSGLRQTAARLRATKAR
jgi:hypothetical protein